MPAKGSFVSALLLASSALAAPAEISKRQTITALSSSQISGFKPFSYFASSAYCSPAHTLAWNCGASCNANADFKPVASGGNSGSVQYWYVGYSPSQATVIVAHQGTDASKIEAIATDATAFQEPLDSSLFPGVSTAVKVHSGFANEQAKTASAVLSAVNQAISTHRATQVTIVGHSLGGALALLDAVYLPLHIRGVSFKAITYGMPRVGNQDFANYVDAHVSVTHINNKEDLVPIVPGLLAGYHHPSGEVHIMDNSQWVSCPGQDNASNKCIVGDVPNVLVGNLINHVGPYDGVIMVC